MMILVAHSYFLRSDPKQVERMRPYAPLGTLGTSALLRAEGHDVAFFDAMLSSGVHEFEAKLDETRPHVVGILEDNFNFLTKMCTLQMREQTLRMVRYAHERGCKVAVNGSDATDHPALYIEAGADAVILGEPEQTFLELTRAWLNDVNAPLNAIAGLAWRNGSLRHTPARPSLTDLDVLPMPAWDFVDVEAYRKAWLDSHGRFSWSMATSRGCPYGCNWCAKPIFGRRYAQRSANSVADEMVLLRERVAPDHIWFADDIFGLTPDWIRDFARAVSDRNARTPFMIQSRVNLMRPDVVDALAEAGAEEVWMGVESGSQRVLDAMDKGSTVEQARTATRELRSRGIRACWFIQLGYPGESWEDLLRTRDLMRAEQPDDIGVSVAYPLPGTKFYESVRAQLGSRQNWTNTGELAVLFRGEYDTAFYKRVRDVLHAEAQTRTYDDSPWSELEEERAVAGG